VLLQNVNHFDEFLKFDQVVLSKTASHLPMLLIDFQFANWLITLFCSQKNKWRIQ